MSALPATHPAAVDTPAERPLLARLSVSMFGMVMGVGGLSNAWALSHTVFGLPLAVSQVLLAVAVAVYAVLLVVHAAKLARHPEAVAEEFHHPVRASFFPAVSVASVVLSIGLRRYAPLASEGLWLAGASLHLVLALVLVRRWVLHAQDESVMTPAWFIPIVGNILVPVGGVPLGYVQASWFFFSIGQIGRAHV